MKTMQKLMLLAVCMLGMSAFAQQNPNVKPGWQWTFDSAKAVVNAVRAGRSLQPARWPNGAKVAVNYDKNNCIDDVCLKGSPISPFPDPRLKAEDLIWVDPKNTTPNGTTLTFQGPGNGIDFQGGAASDQIITSGDFFV